MSFAKAVAIIIGSILVLAIGLSLAMIPFGKPTLWQLIGAPAVVNTEHMIRATGEPDYTWTVHLNEVAVGLSSCSGFDSVDPRAGDKGVFCSQPAGVPVVLDDVELIELENTGTETILRVGGTSYRYDCVVGSPGSDTIDPLLICTVDPLGSIFA